ICATVADQKIMVEVAVPIGKTTVRVFLLARNGTVDKATRKAHYLRHSSKPLKPRLIYRAVPIAPPGSPVSRLCTELVTGTAEHW
ncbi:MAG TPA: hypothetical protein VM842_10025, partial [Nitrospira sp.]|nr:hypothetical protein [Nitrospira sp.]